MLRCKLTSLSNQINRNAKKGEIVSNYLPLPYTRNRSLYTVTFKSFHFDYMPHS